jgi:hypothetical protein
MGIPIVFVALKEPFGVLTRSVAMPAAMEDSGVGPVEGGTTMVAGMGLGRL